MERHLPSGIPQALDAALSAGRKLRERMAAMKQALRDGDESKALNLAREICGLEQDRRAA
ncbi:hypothetical protein JCM15519_17400 [Fundidesulfovibrio butyratiphilus]